MKIWKTGNRNSHMELREKLQEAFQDTVFMCKVNPLLIESIKNSAAGQEVIPEVTVLDSTRLLSKQGRVIVSNKQAFEAAFAYRGAKVAVLNSGSPMSPGMFSFNDEASPEGRLCRESTLYECITRKECMDMFYNPHAGLDDWYNADMIYTPAVTVFKNWDKVPRVMPKGDWFDVDVITMAAPDAGSYRKVARVDRAIEDAFIKAFVTRFTRIMQEAVLRNVDVLVLGDFGCRAFDNDPAIVATAAARVLETYHSAFDVVEFAIQETGKKKNFRMFRLILDRYMNA